MEIYVPNQPLDDFMENWVSELDLGVELQNVFDEMEVDLYELDFSDCQFPENVEEMMMDEIFVD